MRALGVGLLGLIGCGRLDFAPATGQPADGAGPGPDAGCPPTFVALAGSCYLLVHDDPMPATWQGLEARCEAFGAGVHLAVIDDDLELDQVLAAMVDRSMLDAAVGFSDLVTEGTYLTVLGTPAFLRWATGDPDGDDCGGVQATTGRDGTEDTACDALDDYLCEADGRAVDPSAF